MVNLLGRAPEPVAVARTGDTLLGLYDPHDHRVYLQPGADVHAGDTVNVRGAVRRVLLVDDWAQAGLVAEVEHDPAPLPDLGQLRRASNSNGGHFDTTTRQWVGDTPAAYWSGACEVEPDTGDTATAIAEQQSQVQVYMVTADLELVDVQPGDHFTVVNSRDPRLPTRTSLAVISVDAGTSAQRRVFRVIDPQG